MGLLDFLGIGGGSNISSGEKKLRNWANTVTARWEQEQLAAIANSDRTNVAVIKSNLDRFLYTYLGGDYASCSNLESTSQESIREYVLDAVKRERLGQEC